MHHSTLRVRVGHATTDTSNEVSDVFQSSALQTLKSDGSSSRSPLHRTLEAVRVHTSLIAADECAAGEALTRGRVGIRRCAMTLISRTRRYASTERITSLERALGSQHVANGRTGQEQAPAKCRAAFVRPPVVPLLPPASLRWHSKWAGDGHLCRTRHDHFSTSGPTADLGNSR
jgi:hypothetical protein